MGKVEAASAPGKWIPLYAGTWHFQPPDFSQGESKRKSNTEQQEEPIHGAAITCKRPQEKEITTGSC